MADIVFSLSGVRKDRWSRIFAASVLFFTASVIVFTATVIVFTVTVNASRFPFLGKNALGRHRILTKSVA